MKNIIKLTGLVTLILFSFFYTDKVIEVIREEDSIMIELKEMELKPSTLDEFEKRADELVEKYLNRTK